MHQQLQQNASAFARHNADGACHSRYAFAWFMLIISALCYLCFPHTAHAQEAKQDFAPIRTQIAQFLQTQTVGYPGETHISVGNVDRNLKLPACDNPDIFLPPGSRAWGKTSVGVRCSAPTPWTIYVQAQVAVSGQYLIAASPLAQGHIMSAQDFAYQQGDLSQLPAGVFTSPEQVIGRMVTIGMNAGTMLRQEMLKAQPAIQQGQTVQLVTAGNGFKISSEGQAINTVAEGQIAQAKVASGQVVSGIAKAGGIIEITF